MTIWTAAHLEVKMDNTISYIENNQTINTTQLYEQIKLDLSVEEDFDYVIGKGGEFSGKKQASNGNAILKNNDNFEVEIEISFDYVGMNRKDNSSIGDYQKGCIFKFKVDKRSNLISDYNYQQK